MTLGWDQRGCPSGRGSGSVTSRPAQRVQQGLVVDGAAPADVYEDRPRLHGLQGGPVQQVPGLLREGQGAENVVRLSQGLMELLRGEHPVVIRGQGLVHVPAEAGDPAAEGAQQGRDGRGQVARAQHEDLRVVELLPGVDGLPAALQLAAVQLRQLPGEAEGHAQGVLRHGGGVDARRPGDDDILPGVDLPALVAVDAGGLEVEPAELRRVLQPLGPGVAGDHVRVPYVRLRAFHGGYEAPVQLREALQAGLRPRAVSVQGVRHRMGKDQNAQLFHRGQLLCVFSLSITEKPPVCNSFPPVIHFLREQSRKDDPNAASSH